MEIIPKAEEKPPFFARNYLSISIFIIILAIAVYLFTYFVEKNKISQRQQLDEEIARLKTEETLQLEKEIAFRDSQFRAVENLLSQHQFPSQFFPFLEGKLLKKIVVQNLNVDFGALNAEFSGIAENFVDVAKQLYLLRSEKAIKKSEILEIGFTPEGKVSFKIFLSFDPLILK